jgi:hypothetical protein
MCEKIQSMIYNMIDYSYIEYFTGHDLGLGTYFDDNNRKNSF